MPTEIYFQHYHFHVTKIFCKSGVIGRLLGAVVDTESLVGTGASVTVVLCTRMTGHINIFIHIFGTVLVLGGIV